MFCQDSNDEQLQQPISGKRADAGSGYDILSKNIQLFNELGCLPLKLNAVLLGEPASIALLLKHHGAKWHKTCSNKFNSLKLQRAEKRKSNNSDEASPESSKKVTRRSCEEQTQTTDTCFFCEESTGELHCISTLNTDQRVRTCASLLQDLVLIGKLSSGDLISQGAMYHAKCLKALYNKADRATSNQVPKSKKQQPQGIAFAQLVAHIEEVQAGSTSASVFKLAELVDFYICQLEQLGVENPSTVNSTYLKNKILSNFPDLQAYKEGRDVLLVFRKEVGTALKESSNHSFDNEAVILKQAANIVRKELLDRKTSFNGAFDKGCQENSVPPLLNTLVGLILQGANINDSATNTTDAQAIFSISQLIHFNVVSRKRSDTGTSYHNADREPPLPVYLGLLVHAETRKRSLVDKLYGLGLSISYDRVLSLSTELGNMVCARFESENVVCPANLRYGLFTTSAVDNIDHNPSSTTAQGSFHGTGISLFQHPSVENLGEDRHGVDMGQVSTNKQTIDPLPEAYKMVPPLLLPTKEPTIPQVPGPLMTSNSPLISEAMATEYRCVHLYLLLCEF